MTRLILGTRGSKLALAQTKMMAARLQASHPGLEVELKIISTQGDRVLDVALSAVGDKGLFVKELEQALLANEVDFCVHSCKDLPSLIPDGLTLAAFPERADARDLLVMTAEAVGDSDTTTLDSLVPVGSVVGTSSLRRACQLRALRPDLDLRDVRGNVDTRLRKLAEGQYQALVLAAAGIDRLGFVDETDGTIVSDGVRFRGLRIPTEQLLPAVTQGTLAIECRADDTRTIELLAALDHAPSRAAALAERAFLRRLEGGCQVPIAAFATVDPATGPDYSIELQGLVGSLDGAQMVRGELSGTAAVAESMGTRLAEEILDRGGAEILAAIEMHLARQ